MLQVMVPVLLPLLVSCSVIMHTALTPCRYTRTHTHTSLSVQLQSNTLCSLLYTVGIAPVAGMCHKNHSCGVVEHYGLQSSFIAAHEVGHR